MKQGYAIDDEEMDVGVKCVGAPLPFLVFFSTAAPCKGGHRLLNSWPCSLIDLISMLHLRYDFFRG